MWGLIGSRSQRVCGGTFHSVANMLLRRHGRVLGIEPAFTIMDRGDSEDLNRPVTRPNGTQ